MANEIEIESILKFTKGNKNAEFKPGDILVTQTGSNYSFRTMVVSTTTRYLSIATDLTSKAGWFLARNNSQLYSIRLGTRFLGTFLPMIEIKPGEYCCFRIYKTFVPEFESSASTAEMEYLLIED